MGCTESTAETAPIGYDIPMETVLHMTRKCCPPTVVSALLRPSDKVVRLVGRVQHERRTADGGDRGKRSRKRGGKTGGKPGGKPGGKRGGKRGGKTGKTGEKTGGKARRIHSYVTGRASVLVDLELIVETNYMVPVERDLPVTLRAEDGDLDDIFHESDDESVKQILAILSGVSTEEDDEIGGEHVPLNIFEKDKRKPSTSTVTTVTTPVATIQRPPSYIEPMPVASLLVFSRDGDNDVGLTTTDTSESADEAEETTTVKAHRKTTLVTPHRSHHSDEEDDDLNNPILPLTDVEEDLDDYDDLEDLEQLYEFIPGFDSFSDGMREREDFWLVGCNGARVHVPLQSRNVSILTDLTRKREMYGDPNLYKRRKREEREEDYYVGSNRVVGGTLSKSGASRVDYEAANWIRDSKNSDEFPSSLREKIHNLRSEIGEEYFSGSSYGYREASLSVGGVVHMLGVVREEIHSVTGEKMLVLLPFRAKQLLEQKECSGSAGNSVRGGAGSVGEENNSILRILIEDDFRTIGKRYVLSTKDDDGNSWTMSEYEERTQDFAQKINDDDFLETKCSEKKSEEKKSQGEEDENHCVLAPGEKVKEAEEVDLLLL